jgi:hypothetical protein
MIKTKNVCLEETILGKLLICFLFQKLSTEVSKKLYVGYVNYPASSKWCIIEKICNNQTGIASDFSDSIRGLQGSWFGEN